MTATTAAPAKPAEPKSSKPPKPRAEEQPVDLASLRALANCELWSKIVPFDRPQITTQAHVLLCVSRPPRKLCFNTYNGALGKRGKLLPIEEFLAAANSEPAKGKGWYLIEEDLDKVREKLRKAKYELVK